jgi:cell wall integrity and stress response component
VSVQTIAGLPVTVTVSNPTAATTTGVAVSDSNKGLSGGAIAGIVIGSLLGVGLLVAAALWFCCFGRRRQEPEKSPSPESRYDPSIQNTLIENRRQSKGSQMSLMRNFLGPATEQEKAPVSPTDYLNPNNGSAFIDNRMKKDAVLYPHGSRHSTVSLRDNEDYSRPVLRVCSSSEGSTRLPY